MVSKEIVATTIVELASVDAKVAEKSDVYILADSGSGLAGTTLTIPSNALSSRTRISVGSSPLRNR